MKGPLKGFIIDILMHSAVRKLCSTLTAMLKHMSHRGRLCKDMVTKGCVKYLLCCTFTFPVPQSCLQAPMHSHAQATKNKIRHCLVPIVLHILKAHWLRLARWLFVMKSAKSSTIASNLLLTLNHAVQCGCVWRHCVSHAAPLYPVTCCASRITVTFASRWKIILCSQNR